MRFKPLKLLTLILSMSKDEVWISDFFSFPQDALNHGKAERRMNP